MLYWSPRTQFSAIRIGKALSSLIRQSFKGCCSGSDISHYLFNTEDLCSPCVYVFIAWKGFICSIYFISMVPCKDVMQEKLFQKCSHLLYCSVLSLGGNVNTRRMSKPDMRSVFHIKKSMNYSSHWKLLCELSKLSKFNAFNLLGY